MCSACDVKIKFIPFRPRDFTYEMECDAAFTRSTSSLQRSVSACSFFPPFSLTLVFNRSDDGHKMMSMLLMLQCLDITADTYFGIKR